MDKPIVIRLELHPAGTSLTGRASDGTGAAREFAGYLGLVAAIDALIAGASPRPTADETEDYLPKETP